MGLNTDSIIFWKWGPVIINATLVYTWIVMTVLVGGSWLITRRLSRDPRGSHLQSGLEAIIAFFQNQVREVVANQDDEEDIRQSENKSEIKHDQSFRSALDLNTRILFFIGTLFLFIATSNVLGLAPAFESPAASLSTTVALAICVFLSVPIFGIMKKGLGGYLKHYIEPTWIMLPFHIISEITRTISLAIRLFGNVMSGSLLVGILVSVIPLIIPLALQALELLVGIIQAYIFTVLALVYIASAVQAQESDT